MRIHKIISLILVLLFLFTGCDLTAGSDDKLSITATEVESIHITNATGTVITIQDTKSISTIVKYINAFSLTETTEPPEASAYTITLKGSADTILTMSVNDTESITVNGQHYGVDAEKLYGLIEENELATLSDKELLEKIFADSYWDSIDLTNDKGQLSVSKILSLPEQVPAIFELMSRSTMLESVGTYGADILKGYANSADEALRERAEKIGDALSSLIPSIKDKISGIFQK